MEIQDPGSPEIEVPLDVLQVFDGIMTAQNVRAQQETIKQLTDIHDRVQAVSFKNQHNAMYWDLLFIHIQISLTGYIGLIIMGYSRN